MKSPDPKKPAKRPRRPKDDPALRRDPALEHATFDHYADAALYDHEYHRRRADVNWYRAMAGGRLDPVPGLDRRPEVLELGCGTGRLLIPLVRDGLRVTGVDAAPTMLARCRERLDHLPEVVRKRATLVDGDFRALSLGRRFPLIVAPFNAMQHLYTRADLERFLDVVRAHLAPGGVFAFDVLNPDLSWLVRDPSKRWARTRYKDPRTGRTYYYSTNHLYDPVTQINWIRLYYDEAPEVEARGAKGGKAPVGGPSGKRTGGDLNPVEPPRGKRKKGDLTSVEGPSGTSKPVIGRLTGALVDPLSGSRVVELAQRQFFPVELAALLHYNGFSLDDRAGGFVGEPFVADSDSQVCRCSIRAGVRR